jgi:nitrogen regulatory protein PII-like uncharacterized protein
MKQLIGEIITSFFEICRTKEFEREISLYQGHRDAYPQGIVDWLKETENCEEIISAITELTENKVFRDFVLDQVRKEKNEELSELIRKQLTADSERVYSICDIQINEIKKYLEVLDWDWYVENNCKSLSDFMPLVEDWKWILLSQLYGYYKKLEYGRFLPYDKGCPLERYLDYHDKSRLIDDHYGLLKIDNSWVLKSGIPSRVFVPELDTHIILRHISMDLVELIAEWRKHMGFALSIRPDYNVCGDGIGEIGAICEEKDFGRSYSGKLTTIDSLTKYYDRDWNNDWLLVFHDGQDITFEEILEDGPHDQDHFVTQIVHMQFEEEGGREFITHIDHEYAFYSEPGIEVKRNKLQTKGEARTRYKTFKIDNAHIPYVNEANNNILYKVLTCYFAKGELVDEYFKG